MRSSCYLLYVSMQQQLLSPVHSAHYSTLFRKFFGINRCNFYNKNNRFWYTSTSAYASPRPSFWFSKGQILRLGGEGSVNNIHNSLVVLVICLYSQLMSVIPCTWEAAVFSCTLAAAAIPCTWEAAVISCTWEAAVISYMSSQARVEPFHSYSYANASIQFLYNYSLPGHIPTQFLTTQI